MQTLNQTKPKEPKFKTMGDPVREAMVREFLAYKVAMFNSYQGKSVKPYWLTFAGPSGTGKTFMANMILDYVANTLRFTWQSINWGTAIGQIKSGAYSLTYNLREWDFLLIDEIGADRDVSGHSSEQLQKLLNYRRNKWTVLTSNVAIENMAGDETRVASRLIRDGGIVIPTDTWDYSFGPPAE